ncbi:hypothetical protein [Amycolatopsis sp. NPDC004079]|uniref:hypothetical protein n=1 Tax=Amycolatopsis sp. NPDC004079 TaxID=3154549 RepID=UPI0033A5658B
MSPKPKHKWVMLAEPTARRCEICGICVAKGDPDWAWEMPAGRTRLVGGQPRGAGTARHLPDLPDCDPRTSEAAGNEVLKLGKFGSHVVHRGEYRNGELVAACSDGTRGRLRRLSGEDATRPINCPNCLTR